MSNRVCWKCGETPGQKCFCGIPIGPLRKPMPGKRPQATTAVQCPACKGTKKMHIVAKQWENGGFVDLPAVDIRCVTCEGRGTVSKSQQNKLNAEAKLWCLCGGASTFGSYPQDGECRVKGCIFKHHVHCGNCGKISQVG